MKKVVYLLLAFVLLLSLTPRQAAAAGFPDVPKNHRFYEDIMYLLDQGVISSSNRFGIEDYVTREQVAIMVSKSIGLSGGNSSTTFKDVPVSSAASGYINSAVKKGIIQGFPDGTFRPKEIVTRGQMAIFLSRAFDLTVEKNVNFKDMTPKVSSYKYVRQILQANITSGFADNTFRPNEKLKRGQIAAFLSRAMGYGKVYSTKEVVELNDEKIVLIKTDIGQGSGIVVANGLILTNHHVIDGASRATVTFNNGIIMDVKGIVESDSKKDIAILKTTQNFQIRGVSMRASSEGLYKGEKVIAIGSPKGLRNTVSEGIISSLRIIDGVSLIQTNADIDHGSSGGALFNVSGQLIGITSSGYDDVSANLNFAIASEEFVPMVNNYIHKDFNKVNASFPILSIPEQPTKPVQKPILGDVALGMTKQQVKQLSSGNFSSESTNNVYFSNVVVLGYLADISYEFENGRLVAINAYHYIVENQNSIDILEAFFVVLYDEISKQFGKAYSIDTNWYDDEDGFVLSAFWMNSDHNTLLTVKVTMDYETFGGIRISISE